jgi:RimJ/RimL family protein N-acetyltransferase
MNLVSDKCALRPFRAGDEADLVAQANNPRVAKHLRERFPRPYQWKDAEDWIARVAAESPPQSFAITVEDRLAGGIGLVQGTDSQRASVEVGYWLGEAYWGRGIATSALIAATTYAFKSLKEANRVFAYVDEEHAASIRVLEKAGFRLEGRLLGSTIKQGEIRDQLLYAITRREWKP